MSLAPRWLAVVVVITACSKAKTPPAPVGEPMLNVTTHGWCIAGVARPRCGQVALPAGVVEAFLDGAGACARFVDGAVRCGPALGALADVDVGRARDLTAEAFRACVIDTDDTLRCWDRRPGAAPPRRRARRPVPPRPHHRRLVRRHATRSSLDISRNSRVNGG